MKPGSIPRAYESACWRGVTQLPSDPFGGRRELR
jgi:hypothetical protein